MAFMASSPLRRVISDTDEMDVVSSSSTENSVPPQTTPTSNTNTNSHNNSTSPIIRSLRFFSGQNVVMMEDNHHSNNANEDPPVQCHSFPEDVALYPNIVDIGGGLHRSPHMTGNSAALGGADGVLFRASRVGTTVTSSSPPQHYDDDIDDDVDSDTASITSDNSNHHDYNPLLDHASQKSIKSQRSTISARSGQSSRSTQSWGQLTEIDLPPKVNDMEAPTYVLEESPSSQNLWKQTAGHRPPQPIEERAFFERMWAENFHRSQVQYGVPVDHLVTSAAVAAPTIVEEDAAGSESMYNSIMSVATPSLKSTRKEDVAEAILISRMNDHMMGMDSSSPLHNLSQRQLLDKDTTVLLKGLNAFGTTVSKSFAQTDADGLISVTTVNISIASYRVVESKRLGRYAQFHVIYREGNMRDTIGVWKRYRDFQNLASKISDTCDGCSMLHGGDPVNEPEAEHLPNAITSWQLMKKRKRWYRCLDGAYLSLKVFLLERFLHDVLFECSSPHLLRDFVLASVGDDTPSAPNSP
eukprot:scaffold1230_cov166-Amphora_coffeaeformis.AAC.12